MVRDLSAQSFRVVVVNPPYDERKAAVTVPVNPRQRQGMGHTVPLKKW